MTILTIIAVTVALALTFWEMRVRGLRAAGKPIDPASSEFLGTFSEIICVNLVVITIAVMTGRTFDGNADGAITNSIVAFLTFFVVSIAVRLYAIHKRRVG